MLEKFATDPGNAFLLFAFVAALLFLPLHVLGERAGVRGESVGIANSQADAPHPNPLPAYRERGQELGRSKLGTSRHP
jgi:hypothetical protein